MMAVDVRRRRPAGRGVHPLETDAALHPRLDGAGALAVVALPREESRRSSCRWLTCSSNAGGDTG